MTARGNWTTAAGRPNLALRLNTWARAIGSGQISSRTAYALRDVSRIYDGWPVATPSERDALGGAIGAHATRVISRKDTGGRHVPGSQAALEAVRNQATALVREVRTPAELAAIANELLIGASIAETMTFAVPTFQGGHDEQL